ncbi:Iterative polyketide synthase [Talaromyces pinophilus]|nr:Iterative polyketide synthase [Talaromyces pinophilus]
MGSVEQTPSSRFITTLERKYGRNALPNMFDAKAKEPSARPYAYVLKTPNPADGFDEVTYTMLANAVNRASWWLVNEVGLAEGDVFGYMGPSDLRYLILSLASAKTGRRIMLPSLRNTISAQRTLFERTNVSIILYGDELKKNLQPLFDALPEIKTREVLGYKEIFDLAVVPHYEAREITDENFNEPMFFLHTSGSSGNPKPVGESSAFWLATCSFLDVPDDGGDIHNTIHLIRNTNLLQFFPPFHMAGLFFYMLTAILDSSVVINHTAAAITAEHVINIINQGVATSLAAADSILTDLSRTEAGLEALSKMDKVIYGGSPLSVQTGSIIAQRVKNLSSAIGLTENGLLHCIALRGTSHWDCLRFNTRVGYRFEEVSPGVYELIVSLSPKYRMFHPVALLFSDIEEYRTKDLYTRIPEIDNCYRYQGRRDDLIVLSNGEKINPVPLENIVASHPAVKNALFVGEHQFLPSLLIELREGYTVTNEEESREMIEKLWGIISEANLEAPRFSRVPKSLVYILKPSETFNRSGKMTVQRQLTVLKFAAQIDALYSAAGEGLLSEGLELTDPSDPVAIKSLAKKLYAQLLDSDEGAPVVGDDDNVFELGMDSLQVTIAVQKLKAALRAQNLNVDISKIGPHFFYTAPSSNQLAQAIDQLINGVKKNDTTEVHSKGSDRKTYMQAMIDKYTTGLEIQLAPKNARTDSLTVVLTGSTGSLGSYLLHSLIENQRIAKIICLNRSVDARKRQTAKNKQKDLLTPWESSDAQSNAVEFLTADLSKADLGLGEETYSRLLESVDAIIHNAWKVDFNHTIESFEKGHIAGTRHLIDLSRKCTYRAPILFISSISTALNWMQKNPGQSVPESIIEDLESPEFLGYGESKYVSERLIEAHSSSSGLTSSVMRVGQIAGPVLSTAGIWNVQEWFPSLLASSKHLGLLPNSLGTMNSINWVPVDILARIIVQLLDHIHDNEARPSALQVYNLVNPKTVSWSALLDTVQNGLGGPDKIQIVPLTEWVEALERSAQDHYGFVVESNPGIKLLGFWKIISEKSEQSSTAEPLKSNGHVNGEDRPQNEEKTPDLQQNNSEKRKSWLKQWSSKLLSRKDTLGETQQATSNEPRTSDGVVEVKSRLQDEFEVTNLLKDSSEASDLRAVSSDWMKIWLKQWAF